MSTSQKDAVVNAVTKILGKSFIKGSTNAKETLTEDQLTELRETIFKGVKAGDIAYNKDLSDDKAVRRYVNGMIDNHLRKAKELNGGTKYVVKNAGSHSRDPQISALKKLAKNYSDGSAEQTKVLSAISNRESQLSAERQQAVATKKRESAMKNIDTSILPPELQAALESDS
jgi:hypothetical protein